MHTLKQFEPLVIDAFEKQEYHLPKHHHNYFEIIYIYKGCGTHHLNNAVLPYRSGDLFLLAPEDQHYFEIKKSTRFVFIKFTDHYFQSGRCLSPEEFLMQEPNRIMRHKLLKEQKLVFDEPCISILRNTIDNLLAYNCRPAIWDSVLVFHQILSILGLVKEALGKLDSHFMPQLPQYDQLLSYIHENIYCPDKIQIKVVASHFNIAPTYFSAYFKRSFSISYRQYLNDYRATLIERRILHGQFTLKQIADEFGFTDESHLSHFFKNQMNDSPKVYRSKRLSQEV
ncbi:MAG: AraC family transcriptional regulator [Siphonobacter sp.]